MSYAWKHNNVIKIKGEKAANKNSWKDDVSCCGEDFQHCTLRCLTQNSHRTQTLQRITSEHLFSVSQIFLSQTLLLNLLLAVRLVFQTTITAYWKASVNTSLCQHKISNKSSLLYQILLKRKMLSQVLSLYIYFFILFPQERSAG